MNDIIDFHTHRLDASRALISVNPRQFDPQPGCWYSVGFHPWQGVESLTDEDYALLEQCLGHPQVLAVGETGMDNLRGGSLDVQAAAFVRHLRLAESAGKPVVVHSVRTTQQILAIRRREGLTAVPLVIHGMRGNEHVARTWIEADCYLSFGARFNPAALRVTPLDRLLIETDDQMTAIQEVADRVSSSLMMASTDLLSLVAANATRVLNLQAPF